ncbi:MAG: ATP-binding protein [Armatimonadota bacterium]
MSKTLTNLRRVVEEDVSNRTTQMHVLNEAITNAIHANATRIICRLTPGHDVLKTDEVNIFPQKVTAIEVEDNGDGFNDDNYDSFGKYRSDYKAELGCKGVGRLVFLKVFDTVVYSSWLSTPGIKREFTFSVDFESDNLREDVAIITENKTVLSLSNVTTQYLNKGKHVDRRIDLDLQYIKNKVLDHLLPTLFFYKQKGVSIHIEFCNTDSEETVSITSSNIPDFEKLDFSIIGVDGEAYPFSLYYIIRKGNGSLYAFHCANKRTVCEFSDTDLKVSLPSSHEAYMLLESIYFDTHVNNDRNAFEIYPVRTGLFDSLSWEIINTEIKSRISILVNDRIPDANKLNRGQLADIQEERPYLIDYIEPEDIDMAGFIDRDYIIKKAKKRFDDAKEKLLMHVGKTEYSDTELQEAIQITQSELVAYVKDRVLVIEQLKTMLVSKEQSEKIIHNLFMEKYSDDDYYCIGKNNLWLLDDRFTSYSYAASEKMIQEILRNVNLEAGTTVDDDRPDIALFFSHEPSDKQALKSVLIELKSFKDEGKSDRDKFAGIQQLLDYIKAFKQKEDIKEIWAFLVTDVDDKMAERLKTDGYIPLFSTGTSIYYRYYEAIESFIYIFGVETLILDAEARNRVFIDIITRNSRIGKMLMAPLEV